MKCPCVPVFPYIQQFPDSSVGKESACNVRDLGSIPGLGRSPGEGKGYPLQYSALENPMDCIGLRVTKSWTRLSDFHFHFPEVPSWTKWEVYDSSGKAQRDIQTLASPLHTMVLEEQTYVVGLDKEDSMIQFLSIKYGLNRKECFQQAPRECRISRDSQGQRPSSEF